STHSLTNYGVAMKGCLIGEYVVAGLRRHTSRPSWVLLLRNMTNLGKVQRPVFGAVLDTEEDRPIIGLLRCGVRAVEDSYAVVLDWSRLCKSHAPNSARFSWICAASSLASLLRSASSVWRSRSVSSKSKPSSSSGAATPT